MERKGRVDDDKKGRCDNDLASGRSLGFLTGEVHH